MAPETIIDILRHGACEGGEIYRGSTDVSLSELGWQQMQQSAHTVSPRWQHVISSPMQRCTQFAKKLAVQHGIEMSNIDDLRETYFGDWEGRLVKDVWDNNFDEVNAWVQDPMKNPPPNGESTVDLMARVTQAFTQLSTQYQGQHIGVVTHGGVIRVLLAHLLQSPMNGFTRIDVPYACLTRIKVLSTKAGNYPRLVFHNVNHEH